MATLRGYGTCSPSFTTVTAVTFSYTSSAGISMPDQSNFYLFALDTSTGGEPA